MENAVDALKIGFAILVFIMALSLSMYMYTEARETADIVLHSSDISEFMEYTELIDDMAVAKQSENRVVGLETIIPTLYKYYKENYTIIFRKADGSFLEIYKTATEPANWGSGDNRGLVKNKYYRKQKY